MCYSIYFILRSSKEIIDIGDRPKNHEDVVSDSVEGGKIT